MIEQFKKFLFRGNVVDLAVAVVIGAAFKGVVDSMVTDIITPLLGLIGGQPDFSNWQIGPVMIGNFINAAISFLIMAAAIFFAVVKPMNLAMERFTKKDPKKTRTCPECAKEIPIAAKRCPECTSMLEAAPSVA
ncbi:MAG: large conductance mechanosensitive channel protein MscL [Chloroflexota bacterium]